MLSERILVTECCSVSPQSCDALQLYQSTCILEWESKFEPAFYAHLQSLLYFVLTQILFCILQTDVCSRYVEKEIGKFHES